MVQRVDVQYVQFYTQGNTAKRVVSPVTPKFGTVPAAKKKKIQRIYVDPVAALGIVVATVMLIMMAVGITQLCAEHRKTAEMSQCVEQLQMENMALQAQYNEECDLEAIHKTALALGMIPQEEAVRIPIEIELPPQELPQVSLWQRIGTFLTGLFA